MGGKAGRGLTDRESVPFFSRDKKIMDPRGCYRKRLKHEVFWRGLLEGLQLHGGERVIWDWGSRNHQNFA